MKTEDIKKMAQAWQSVQEASKKKMDPVDQDELKGTHAQRKDKDIDNDGKVDKSDEYLHNRRKAVSKAIKGKDKVEVTMSSKTSDNKMSAAEQKESTLPPVYARILEKRAMHYKGATPQDPMDKGQSPGGKKMKADVMAGAKYDETEEKGHNDVVAAGRVTKKSPARRNDRAEGDKNVINPSDDVTKKGQGE